MQEYARSNIQLSCKMYRNSEDGRWQADNQSLIDIPIEKYSRNCSLTIAAAASRAKTKHSKTETRMKTHFRTRFHNSKANQQFFRAYLNPVFESAFDTAEDTPESDQLTFLTGS